jgi:amino acid adenylation domain-containing protein
VNTGAAVAGANGAWHQPNLVSSFTETVQRHPDSPAISHNGQTLTYAGLAARARAVADLLANQSGSVAVAVTHAPHSVIGLLGVWLAGGVYCPVDPAFPAERRRAMLAAVGCRTFVDTDLVVSSLAVAPASADAADVAGGAYTLFTSGSTSAPKPVLTGHRAIAATVRALRDLFGLTAADRVLQFASLNWDTCFEEILPALTSGAELVFDDEAYTGSFPRFLRMIERTGITVLDLPSAFWHELVIYLVEAGAVLPSCVRLVIIGGEAVSPARLHDWCASDTSGVRLLNTYGCTETTLITHAVDLHGPLAPKLGMSWERTARIPIGRPLVHVVERISDEGELLIGGPALADGYVGLPEATRARFVDLPGGRFFRTGDRVSRMVNGMLVYEGRLDDTVKIRGIRVDPAEVEAHIARHPAVGAVAVTGVRVADRTVLAAYVVPRTPPIEALAADILEHLRGSVPAYLIPSRITIVADLAYTPSGKVDRHRIKETLP